MANFVVVTQEWTWLVCRGLSSYISCSMYCNTFKCIRRKCQQLYSTLCLVVTHCQRCQYAALLQYWFMIIYQCWCRVVCDKLSWCCRFTVFPVEQNTFPQPQGFLMSKHRPQRTWSTAESPGKVLYFQSVQSHFTVSLVSVNLAPLKSKNSSMCEVKTLFLTVVVGMLGAYRWKPLGAFQFDVSLKQQWFV